MQAIASESQAQILIVDDDVGARESLELILEDRYGIESVEDGILALDKIREKSFDLVLLDVTMPNISGIEVLKRIKDYNESIYVIMVSAADRAREATVSLKLGAFDYITKPYEPEQILSTVQGALKRRSMEALTYCSFSDAVFNFGDVQIVSRSKNMYDLFRMIGKVAKTSSNVLITGESGTGKELIARAIHASSPRKEKPFVAINCAAIPPALMESEMFGHERGSFTGAHARGVGKFEYAHKGTIFLDEISSLRIEFQAKLLRVLQEREFTRVGGHQTIKVDVRVIAATNTRLEDMVQDNKFRQDLYFRLNVLPVTIPPLRERKKDISLLSNYFLSKYNLLMNKKVKGISPEALNVLEAYPWPGNVRELENLIERLVVLSADDQWIDEECLPIDHFIQGEEYQATGGEAEDLGLLQARQVFEKKYILRALEQCKWRQAEASRLLKIHRNTLLLKMRALNIRASQEHD